MKKTLWGIALAIVIVGILYLTLQSPEQTTTLSEWLREWLNNHGLYNISKNIRSNIHIVEFFIFGIVLALFGRTMGWSILIPLVFGSCICLLDEGIKEFLPTREFEVGDLIKDLLGVIVAIVIVYTIKKKRHKVQFAPPSGH